MSGKAHVAVGATLALAGLAALATTFLIGTPEWLLAAWAPIPLGFLFLAWGGARLGDGRGTLTRYGYVPVVFGLVDLVSLALFVWSLVSWPALVGGALGATESGFALEAVIAIGATLGVLWLARPVLATLAIRRGARMQPGTKGRARLQLAGLTSLLELATAMVPTVLLLKGTQLSLAGGFGFTYGIPEAELALPGSLQTSMILVYGIAGIFAFLAFVLRMSLWFLEPERFRFWFWVALDVVLVAAFAFVTLTLPIQPANEGLEALVEPVIRLAITSFFALRVYVRILPFAMQGFEVLRFETLVAARHLRAKKSGFLAAIGGLSIAAVAVSTAMLVGVLSVMGGFRDDLKQKILGNQAHVVVDRENATFEGWSAVLDEVTGSTDEIAGASPYVSGEVMVTSATNMAGAVLRGIDPDTVGSVTDLERNLTRGRLDYLRHPEQLLNLPAEERRTILPLEIEIGRESEGLVREIEDEIRRRDDPTEPSGRAAIRDDLDELLGEPPPPPAANVLPGIVLGKELARSLRVYVGDEIDVVSPNGELGPAGPMPKSRRFRVAGVFYSGMYEFDMKHVYVLLEQGQRFLGTGDAITGIEVKVRDVDRAPQTADAIRRALHAQSDLRVRDWQELNSGLFGALELEKLAMFITLGIAVLIAGFCVFGTLTLMVQEKQREVGILFAMGSTRRSIVSVFVIEGFLIGLNGAIFGLGLGYLVTFVFEHFGFRLNPEVYYIDRLPVSIDPMEFVVVGLIALAVCVVSTIFPAVLASRLRPVDALRLE
ncbi:MAG: ABC transporter permease [Sandaracinus sp.]|nr:ABC transporter permease [Sandaracinus sp.]